MSEKRGFLNVFLTARLNEQQTRAQEWADSDNGGFLLNDAGKELLREIAAKRAVIELHKSDGDPDDSWYGKEANCVSCGGYTVHAGWGDRGFRKLWPCPTLRLMLSAYSDHPEWRPEWAITT